MKNLAKIFMAIVAFAAYSCAVDSTSDLGLQVGGDGGQTTLTLSLEETKTQLGAETESLYALLWSEGDQISINGVASNPLAAQYDGKASATFKIPTVAETYNIAYPAANEGQVMFAENQVHTANHTFGKGVTTMYAKCAADATAQLKHLTAVLKIGVVGSATLTHAQISTIDRAPIAGAFALDFESGKVTATEASKSVINYSFGDGVTLSSEPTYIHVAVPAGTYDELYVTLYDNAHGVMYATVPADSNAPITAGKLRSFKNNVNYAATDKVFVIKEYLDLEDFAAVAADTTMDVVLANDIEVTEAWTPIEGYAGTVLGHGYAIKGLTAPLFGTTSASFKGLHLEGVAINETVNPNVGAFARKVVATDTVKPVIENCSASGTLTVKCESHEYDAATGSIAGYAIGGLVGHIKGVDIKDCTNNIAIDVDQVIATSNAKIIYPSIAGVVGLVDIHTKADESTKVISNLSGLVNNGAIDVHEVSYTKANYVSPVVPYVAGVAARFVSDNLNCVVTNITNNGTIHLQGKYGEGKTDDNTDKDATDKDDVNYNDIDPCLGGVFGYISAAECSNVHNYGTVTFENSYSRFHYIGGVAGIVGKHSELDNIHNHAAVTLKTTARIASLHCAGVIAHSCESSSLNNGSNEGKITAKSTTVQGAAGHRFHRIGGVVGFADGSVTNCENKEGGMLDCGGTINNANNWRDVCFGGVVAYKESDPIQNCTNHADLNLGVNIAKPSDNDPDGGGLNDATKRFSVGGVVGLTAQPCNNVTNRGKLTLWGKAHSWYVGGCVGDMNYGGDKGVGGYYNYGVINFKTHATHATNDYIVFIGGCIGYAKGAVSNVVNYADGTLQIDAATFSKDCYIGGCIGCVDKATGDAKGTEGNPITNNAAININGTTFGANSYIGGVAGRVADAGAKASYLTNNGAISFINSAKHTAGNPHIGGILGDTKGAVTNLTNNASGAITVANAAFPGAVFFGGVVGRAQASADATITSSTNKAPITIGTETTFAAGAFRVGGIVSHSEANLSNVTNEGAISIGEGGLALTASTGIYVGGIIGQNAGTGLSISNATNSGNITIHDGMTMEGVMNIRFGGVVGQSQANLSTVKNTGTITLGTCTKTPLTFNQYTLIGGIVGEFNSNDSGNYTISGAINEGNMDINIKHTTGTNYQMTAFGGLVGLANRGCTYTNSHNSGNITIGGKTDVVADHLSVGGFFGVLNGAHSFTNCYNRGTVKVEATAKLEASKDQHVGGLAGYISNAPTINATDGFRNIGNIEVYNAANVPGKCYVGGIGGNVTKLIQNAQVVCDIVAPGATYVGMVIGQQRNSQLAKNCKLGGRIAKSLENGEPKYKTVWSSKDTVIQDEETGETTLMPDAPEGEIVPFWEVIYGGTWADASATTCDGCSYLGSITIQ